MNKETSVKHSTGEEIVERDLDFFLPQVRVCAYMCVCARVCVRMCSDACTLPHVHIR
jgi:hypothetical protein